MHSYTTLPYRLVFVQFNHKLEYEIQSKILLINNMIYSTHEFFLELNHKSNNWRPSSLSESTSYEYHWG